MNAAVQILDIFFMLWANSKLLLYLLNNLKMILKFPVNFYHQRFKTQFIMNATRAFTQPFGIRKDCIHLHQRGQFPLIPKEVLFEQQSTRTSKVDWTNSQKTSCQKQTSSRADRVLLSPASFFFFFKSQFQLICKSSKEKLDTNVQMQHLSFTCCFKRNHGIRPHNRRKQTFRAAVRQVVSQGVRQRLNRTNQFRSIMYLSTLKRGKEIIQLLCSMESLIIQQ